MAEPSSPRTRPSFADPADLDRFVEQLGRFERGEIDADAWRAFRLLHGAYDQRQGGDLQMLRVKLPQGLVTADQLEALAEVVERHARGFGHLTTRQDLQLHFVTARGAEAALRRLAAAGLTSREACGNSVRNVTACPLAGISPGELFDVTPYAEALSRHFLRHPLSGALPRKFKVAFEGCPDDHAASAIHDLGFTARIDGGRRGFEVRVGGGTAVLPTSAAVLVPFLPAADLLSLAEAVLRVFHRLGERRDRAAARLKHLVRRLGFDAFRREVEAELARVAAEGGHPLPFDPARPPEEGPPAGARPAPLAPAAIAARVTARAPRGPGLPPRVLPELAPSPEALAAFLRTNVRAQRQPGWIAVEVVAPLGDLTGDQLAVLAALSRAHSDGTLRVTRTQDLLLRWVPAGQLPALHAGLAAAGLARPGAGTAEAPLSCPGAESCRLAVTHARGLARLVEERLRARPGLAPAAPDLDVAISGCPNGCGQHHVAAIGLQGGVRKIDGRAVPHYLLSIGGGFGGGEARFGRHVARLPARRVPEAIERLLRLHLAERRPGEGVLAHLERIDPARVSAALEGLDRLDPGELDPLDVVDPGSPEDTARAGEPARALFAAPPPARAAPPPVALG